MLAVGVATVGQQPQGWNPFRILRLGMAYRACRLLYYRRGRMCASLAGVRAGSAALMPIEWIVTLTLPLLTLVIPAAALGGRRMRGGPVALMAGGALLAFLVLWLQGETGVLASAAYPLSGLVSIADVCLLFGGMLLALGACAAALIEAARARNWSLIALLTLAVYLSSAAFIGAIALTPFSSCLLEPLQPVCASPPLAEQALLAAAGLIAPSAILAYALSGRYPGDPGRRPAQRGSITANPISAPEPEPPPAL